VRQVGGNAGLKISYKSLDHRGPKRITRLSEGGADERI
jgi:hypothetical protein